MRDLFAAKEDQVSGAHLRPLDRVIEKAILLIGVARNEIAAHAIAKLHKAAAINALPARADPEIRHAEQHTRARDAWYPAEANELRDRPRRPTPRLQPPRK